MNEDTAAVLARNADFGRICDLYPVEYLAEKFNSDALVVVKARYLAGIEAAHQFGLLSDDELSCDRK